MIAFVIAVDGPAASGKGTLSSMLAETYGLPMLDTGMLYRAVGAQLLAEDKDPADAGAAEAVALTLDLGAIDPEAIRSGPVGEAASQAAAHPGVRQALLALQRDFAATPGGAVLDGRDIGTVICPEAPCKLFVTASPEARAHRRWLQLNGRGEAVTQADVLEDIRRRDERDSGRSAAPLVQAADAVLLDTTQMSISEAADAARRIVEEARARWTGS
jgi:cytidylate kinase